MPEKTKTSYDSVFRFINTANNYLARQNAIAQTIAQQNGDKAWQHRTAPPTKLAYAIERMRPRVDKIRRLYSATNDDLNIAHCEADDKGVILTTDQGHYRFKKENKITLNRELEQLNEAEVEIEPYFATSLPPDLILAEVLAFEGFVLESADTYLEDRFVEPASQSATA